MRRRRLGLSPQRSRGLIPPPSKGKRSEPRASGEGGRARSARTGGALFRRQHVERCMSLLKIRFPRWRSASRFTPPTTPPPFGLRRGPPSPLAPGSLRSPFARGRDEPAVPFLTAARALGESATIAVR